MIILPDKNIPRARILLPMKKAEWIYPSHAETKTAMGHAPIEKRWRVSAILSDGHVRWKGIFIDREDADAFFYAAVTGTINHHPELWRLPVPMYMPDFGEGALFKIAASVTYTNTTAGAQTIPSDFSSFTSLHAIGAGAKGTPSAGDGYWGGGGGGYASITTLTGLTAGGTVYTKAGTANGGSSTGQSWFNKASNAAPASTTNGILATGGSLNQGGTSAGAIGHLFNGGNGGSSNGVNGGSGGGGAGGPNGAGSAGTSASGNNGTAGGAGNAGVSGGGAGGTAGGTGNGGNGGAGTYWDGVVGPGGGGGGGGQSAAGGNGGSYGGGAGGAGVSGTNSSVAAQGFVYLDYTPTVLTFGNLAMMGM